MHLMGVPKGRSGVWTFRKVTPPPDRCGVMDRVGSRRLRTVTLPHHRTCRFQHPAVEPRSSLSVVGTRRLSLACPRSGGGGCTTGPFFVGWIVIAVIASARLACLFGLSFASFFFSSALWFFGPSLLAPFRASLHYYSLC